MESGSTQRIAETMIGPESEGIRLDFYLQKRFSYRSRTEWQKSIDDGEILLNGKPAKSSRRLHAGEKITFSPKSLEEPPVDPSYEILADTPDFLAVSKSGSLPCHPAGVFFRHTLWFLLREKYGENIHIATRLDRETSGVVLIAKNPGTAAEFTRALMSGNSVRKTYLAIVHGAFPADPIHAEGWLSSDPDAHIRKKRRFTREQVPDSESSCTDLRLIARLKNDLSLVEACPATGRLHQIRATLCSLGYPMAGDKLYGLDDRFFERFAEDALTDEDRRMLILPRQALHASELSLPFRGGILHFESPLPEDMKRLTD